MQRTGGAPTVHVVGNHLVNGKGRTIRLLGVNRSGTEYACAQGWGIFDGPNTAASVAAMKSWHINAVRLPLNEACWLGLPGLDPAYAGTAYRKAIHEYVDVLHAHGLIVIVDLHVAAPREATEVALQKMADAAHTPAFWRSVARSFKRDHSVLFDVFNEPHDLTWACWRKGCSIDGYQAVGMQRLVKAIRSTGATQPIMLGGVDWSGDLSRWLRHKPKDPLDQLVASIHTYDFHPCVDGCREQVHKVAIKVPVVTGEVGDSDCNHDYLDDYMSWADQNGVSYLGWTWNAGGGWTCNGGPTLIQDYSGTPSGMGIGLQQHLLEIRP